MAKTLKLIITGDTKSLERALGKTSGKTTMLTAGLQKLKSAAKYAALALGAAAVGGVAYSLKMGIDEFIDASKVAAQTEAVLKSTGGSANVTAEQIDSLALALMNKSGIDDEVIKSGENLLLTFTNIQNKVGKGNDIFNQATATMLDMSVALGQDTKSSAIQLGKALNDPVKGITALTRVGVSFTQGQKDTIKSLVKSGKTLEAQKIILAELNKEFGGSAKAIGETLPGRLNILREKFSNLMGRIVERGQPFAMMLMDWADKKLPKLEKSLNKFMTWLGSPEAAESWAKFVAGLKAVWAVLSAISKAVKWQFDLWHNLFSFLGTASLKVENAYNTIKTFFANIKTTISNTLSSLKATASSTWSSIKNSLAAAGSSMIATASNIIARIKSYFNVKLRFPSISFPRIKLPHFKLTGSWDLIPPGISMPRVGVDWYHSGGKVPGIGDRLVVAKGGERFITDEQDRWLQKKQQSTVNIGTVVINSNSNNPSKLASDFVAKVREIVKQEAIADLSYAERL